MKKIPLILALSLSLAFIQCATKPQQPAIAATQYSKSIPSLQSSDLESKWGAPKAEKKANGDYVLTYSHPTEPFNRVLIYASSKTKGAAKVAPNISGEDMVNGELAAVSFPQKFSTAKILGISVNWYQESLPSGADGAYFSTVEFPLTNGGKTGYYRVVLEGEKSKFKPHLSKLNF